MEVCCTSVRQTLGKYTYRLWQILMMLAKLVLQLSTRSDPTAGWRRTKQGLSNPWR